MTDQACITCDGTTLKALAEAGRNWLHVNYQKVNELNVFPVPDGDTGTNMLLTMQNAYQEIAGDTSRSAAHIASRLAHGAIMGSRGNSGTIMSQIWVGFAEGLDKAEIFDLRLAVAALRAATNKAYAGVQTPVEGTILTVIRELAEEAALLQETTTDLSILMERLVTRGWEAVARTPDLLPILKKAGVVDSGGAGLVYMLEGMLKYLRGEDITPVRSLDEDFAAALAAIDDKAADLTVFQAERYNYDVQFVIKGVSLQVAQIKADIEAMGDSGVIIGDEHLVKVHIHVDDPSLPIGYAVKLGMLDDVVVENMQAQYEARLKARVSQPQDTAIPLREVTPGEIAVVAVAPGQGLARVLGDLGVAGIVDGGQTNNPSTEEILAAVRATGTDRIIILPNNKNIVLTAEQAARTSPDAQIKIVPTVSFPQGIAAMLAYRPDGDFEEVLASMMASKNDVVTVEVTTATRSVELDGVTVQTGQYIALINGKLRAAGNDLNELIRRALDEIDMDDYSVITLYYGAEVTPETAEALAESLSTEFTDHEISAIYGGQPHYFYIIGIE